MRKKILVVTDNTRDQINGVVTTFKNIEDHARRDGYDIVYIDPGQFSHIDAPGYSEVKLSWPAQIGKKIKEIQPDHIHIATEGPIGLAANLYCWFNDIKFNTSYHTKFPEFLKKIYRIPMWITYRYLRWFHKHSGKVLTTTDSIVRELREHDFTGEIITWPRGVDRTIFRSTLRGETVASRPILLNVGRISKEKGIEDFCKINYPGATKIVVGDGPYKQTLEKLYPDVLFVGAKTGESLAKYFAQADVFVFPSVNDTFGVVIIEALAVGTPVAAYPVQGPADILTQGINGYMSNDLRHAVDQCLRLDRITIEQSSDHWTWENTWFIFRDNLV